MKVKIGEFWYHAEDCPIVVDLTDKDKENIKNMDPSCSKYAVFPDDWKDQQQMEDFME